MTTDTNNTAPTDADNRPAGAGPVQRSVSWLDPKRAGVVVLFARADSHYKALAGVDVWDEARDARKWPGGAPLVAHPPCRAWGRLRTFARPASHEKDLARWAVAQVRRWGGVLEHPAGSTLWTDQCLPRPGQHDKHGGWTLPVSQKWWGHKAEKATWLYVCGATWRDMPPLPLTLGEATHVVQTRKRGPARPHISKAEREMTPPDFGAWLVELAGRCNPLAQS